MLKIAPKKSTPLQIAQLDAVLELSNAMFDSLNSRFDISEANGILTETRNEDSDTNKYFYLLPMTKINEILAEDNTTLFKQEGEYYIETHIVDEFGLQPKDLIDAYLQCNKNYQKVANKLASIVKPESKLTASKVENRLKKLVHYAPELFSAEP